MSDYEKIRGLVYEKKKEEKPHRSVSGDDGHAAFLWNTWNT